MGAADKVTGVGANVPRKTKLKFALTRVDFHKLCKKSKAPKVGLCLIPSNA